MRFLIIDKDYVDFLDALYLQHPGLRDASFEEQMRTRMNSLFIFSDAYSNALRARGHETFEVNFNNLYAQSAWAKENGIASVAAMPQKNPSSLARGKLRAIVGKHLRRAGLQSSRRKLLLSVLKAQIEKYRPDVLFNHALEDVPPPFLREVKGHVGLVVGQHAAMPTPNALKDASVYDLVISSFPPTVEKFRKAGTRAELVRLYFDPRVLDRVPPRDRMFDVSFVGSLFQSVHGARIQFLEGVAKRVPQLKIWGPTPKGLAQDSPLHSIHQGPAWGVKMFEILGSSRITLNHHGSIPPFANNLRLYEATGMKALLVTDHKQDLHEIFELDREVISFKSAEGAAESISHYLASPNEAERIAAAGQTRTLRDHNPNNRVDQLLQILETIS